MADERRGDQTPPLYVSPEAAAIAGEMDGPAPPRWPKVIGIISIVFGSLGVICGGVGIGWQLLMPGFLSQMPGGAPPTLMSPSPINLGVGAVSTLWTIILVVAGAMTVARKPGGRTAHLVWAFMAVVFGVVGLYMQVKMNAEIATWIADNPDSEFAKQPQMPIIGYLCGGFFLGWPLFTLVWFGLIKKKGSDLTEGVTEQVA